MYLFMGVLIGSAVIPVVLVVIWKGATASGMIYGATVGSATAVIAWLVTASTFDGGLNDFFTTTGKYKSIPAG